MLHGFPLFTSQQVLNLESRGKKPSMGISQYRTLPGLWLGPGMGAKLRERKALSNLPSLTQSCSLLHCALCDFQAGQVNGPCRDSAKHDGAKAAIKSRDALRTPHHSSGLLCTLCVCMCVCVCVCVWLSVFVPVSLCL
jgi:hypothetical protein